MRKILNWVRRKIGSERSYWNTRAMKYGIRAVLNLGHSSSEVEQVTKYQIEKIFPHLSHLRDRNEIRKILDYGCGPGRFSVELAQYFNAQVTAVDPIQKFLDLAPKSESVNYSILSKFRKADISFDFIWVCLVLGGLSEDQIEELSEKLSMQTSSGASLCLIENTSKRQDAAHWKFRSTQFYQSIFRDFNLKVVGTYEDMGEEISIMLGARND